MATGAWNTAGPTWAGCSAWAATTATTSSSSGFRFGDLRIPQGATITGASLRFTSLRDNASDVTFDVRAEDEDHTETFGTKKEDISDRNLTDAAVSWTPEAWEKAKDYTTNDLSTIVQEVVDREGLVRRQRHGVHRHPRRRLRQARGLLVRQRSGLRTGAEHHLRHLRRHRRRGLQLVHHRLQHQQLRRRRARVRGQRLGAAPAPSCARPPRRPGTAFATS